MNVGKHFLSPKLEVRAEPEKGGFGVFAREAVSQVKLSQCGAATSSTRNNWKRYRMMSSSIRCRLKRACT